jgi:hypothetical protein
MFKVNQIHLINEHNQLSFCTTSSFKRGQRTSSEVRFTEKGDDYERKLISFMEGYIFQDPMHSLIICP